MMIKAKFPCKCHVCNVAIVRGAPFDYRKGFKPRCVACSASSSTPPAPVTRRAPATPAALFDDGAPVHIRHWTTLESFVDDTQRASVMSDCDRPSRKSSMEWNGNISFNEAVHLAQFGWNDGAKQLLESRTMLADNSGEKPTYSWDKTGEFFDVGTMLSGNPDCWLDTVSEPTPHYVKIAVQINFGGSVTADALMRRGAAICSLVDGLEANGARVALLWVSHSEGLNKNNPLREVLSGDLKSYDQPLDMDRVAFALINPAMPRRLVFSYRETQNERHLSNFARHGNGCAFYQKPPELPSDCIFFAGDNAASFNSTESTRAWLDAQLETLLARC